MTDSFYIVLMSYFVKIVGFYEVAVRFMYLQSFYTN